MGERSSGGKLQNYQVNGDDNGQDHNFSLFPSCSKERKSSPVEKRWSSMNYVGQDLLLLIFLRLPDCRSAIRCRAVSKL
ncbi:hypothetical protein TIFTF001_029366 [Ficus carica]|uniref:Uncharacterized protein n=1 Tax=Ficus carica TaxID=3494 RepID=A0AA88DVV1_FICCA|nr:hypothetical protein TIFTF001_029366 [Ficus carica]